LAEKMEKIGTCAYCGQTRAIETIGEVTQAELDVMATERCLCQEAQAEKRKKAREAKIKEFIHKKFPYEKLAGEILMLVDCVLDSTFEDVTIKLYKDKVVRIWKDSDNYIRIKIKRTEDDELKA